MLAESFDEDQIIARVAAVDIGKAELVCCVRVPATADAKRRLQEVSTHPTMTRALAELANHLVDLRIERVVMEATSDYWRPVFSPARGASARATQDRCSRCGVVVQGRGAADAAAELRAAATDPGAAGLHPLSDRSGRGTDRGEEPGREAARGRLHQGVGGRQRHLRC